MHTHTHTHSFNGPLSGTTQVSRYQKGKTKLDFSEAKDSAWHWHQLGHMQVCTSIQTDNHASTHRSVFTGRMPFLPPNQQRQSTEGTEGFQYAVKFKLHKICQHNTSMLPKFRHPKIETKNTRSVSSTMCKLLGRF